MLQGKTEFASAIAKVKENALKKAEETITLFMDVNQ
jgi:hypothetical protein